MTTPVRRRAPRSVTEAARDRFLAELAEGWPVTHAAAVAGSHRRRMYELRDQDEAFAAAWDDAIASGTERLEQHAMELALTGVLVEVRDGDGKLIRTERRPDPATTRFMLAARKPEVYSERARIEVTGANGGPVELAADYRPTTLADVVRLVRELGLDDDVIDGEGIEVAQAELTEGEA